MTERSQQSARQPLSPLTELAGADVEAGTPWGMNIAVRFDKVHPPRRIDVAEATARAVVTLLASQQAAPGGPWHEAVQYWRDGRIRKLVRRARGIRWDEVQLLPGVTITQEGPRGWAVAQARAFVPAPVRPLPAALAKTQVEGTHFPHGDELPPAPAAVRAAYERAQSDLAAGGQSEANLSDLIELTDASTSDQALVTIEVTPLHAMTSGKLCAQVGHGAQLAWESAHMPEQLRQAWARDNYRVRVVFPSAQSWNSTPRPISVVDAGFTELDGPTETVRAYW